MIGGEEWDAWYAEEEAIRQREWDAWKAARDAAWARQKRKYAYRRERGDIKRGHWEITEPLTTDE